MRTLIAVPCMDMIHACFTSSLVNMLLQNKEYDLTVEFGVSSLIYDTRNQLIARAIDGEYDRILWLDSDMVFEPEILRVLFEDLDHGFDIVSGLYFGRVAPSKPIVFSQCDIEQLEDGRLNPLSEAYWDYPDNSLFEAAAFGFGCVAMNVSALKNVVDTYGKLLFMPVGGFGEDMSFCMRARSAGVKLWCDSRVKLGHSGHKVYTEEDYRKAGKDGNQQHSDPEGQDSTAPFDE